MLIFELRRREGGEVSSSGVFVAMESGEGKVCVSQEALNLCVWVQEKHKKSLFFFKHLIIYLHAADESTERTTKDNVLLFLYLILTQFGLEFSSVWLAKTR